MARHRQLSEETVGRCLTVPHHHEADTPDRPGILRLDSAEGRQALRDHYRVRLEAAAAAGQGLLLESPTRHASRDWCRPLGYDPIRLADLNRRAIALMALVRREQGTGWPPVLLGGFVGPRLARDPDEPRLTGDEAMHYHREQIAAFATTEADLIVAGGLAEPDEALGIVRAAGRERMPLVVGFVVDAGGRLPSGEAVAPVIARLDAERRGRPLQFWLESEHPESLVPLHPRASWIQRVRAVRAAAGGRPLAVAA